MAKNTSYPPIKDGVKADNSTYSSNQIDRMISEVEGSIPDLPEAATSDIGKVLGIVSDGSTGAEYGTISIENELPEPEAADIGKIVGVVSDGSTGAEYGVVDAPQGYKRVIANVWYDSESETYQYFKNHEIATFAEFEADIAGADEVVIYFINEDDSNNIETECFLYKTQEDCYSTVAKGTGGSVYFVQVLINTYMGEFEVESFYINTSTP